MKRFAVLVAALLLWPSSAMAAPVFADLGDGPARPAVESLSRQGVVEGYPDATFRGNRAASRDEVAQIVARVMALDEKAHGGLASTSDPDALRVLLRGLTDDATALEGRASTLETRVHQLEGRTRSLKRP
jgi:hypothetical protein